MGNDAFGTNLPQTRTPEDAYVEITKAAKFSRTQEFKELKKYLEARIEYYQTNLPGGTPIVHVDPAITGAMWVANDVIIREFKAVIEAYEGAAQQLKDAKNELTR
jgi:hypothetical protein